MDSWGNVQVASNLTSALKKLFKMYFLGLIILYVSVVMNMNGLVHDYKYIISNFGVFLSFTDIKKPFKVNRRE